MSDWASARAVADELAEAGVDPLDVDAARAASIQLVRRFVFNLLALFGMVAVLAAVALMLMRAFTGGDPTGGREIWVASGALAFLLVVVATRSVIATGARAYEAQWSAFVQRVWPGARKGDDLGTARLTFARRAASADPGPFPSVAPGRKG
ncbi:hypothetical protein BH09ACT4_BH09ACT4_08620 [soil metagenome]